MNKHYYQVPADKIGLTLLIMDVDGWEMDNMKTGEPIMKHYIQATSRDWDGHIPVFCLVQFGKNKLVSITSNLLMKAAEFNTYDDLKSRLGIRK